MVIKYIDYLSPKISLFYNGNKSHPSNLGSILTLIMMFFCGIYVFYLIYNIASHNVSNFMFYKNYLDDAGYYAFNDNGGIFHYFQLYDLKNQNFGQYNSKYVRLFMSRVLYKTFQENSLLENEHWVYDKCRDGIDNKNIAKEVFEENNNFNKGACLRYYYDNKNGKYYPIEDKENFKYPYLIHGSGRSDNLLLETVIEKCDNKSILTEILGPCGKEEEIDNYLNVHKAAFFQLLETKVNTENYSKSIYQYIYSISGSLDIINVPVNNVNLMPFFIEIKRGIILPKTLKKITYIFDDNRKTTFENSHDKNFLAIFDYWLVNTSQIVKGGYSNLYDILPNIGGIIQLIYYIFYSLNYLYNNYIVINDCNQLLFTINNKDYNEKENEFMRKKFKNYVKSLREEIKLKKKKFQLKRIKRLKGKNNIIFENQENRNQIIKTEFNSNKKNVNKINSNNNEIIDNSYILSNSNDIIMDFGKKDINPSVSNFDVIKYRKKYLSSKDKIKINEKESKKNEEDINYKKNKKMDFLYYQFSYQLKQFLYHKNNELKIEPFNKTIVSQFITFNNYIISLFGNKNKKRAFFILNKFREKILGEENLFRTKFYLYYIEKYFNIKEIGKIDILELYNN